MEKVLITVYAASWQTWQPAVKQSCKLTAPDRGRISPAWVRHSAACVPSLWDHTGASAPAWPGGDCCHCLSSTTVGFGAPRAFSLSPTSFKLRLARDTWRKSFTLGALGGGANCRAFFWNNHHLPFPFTPGGPLDCRGLLPKGRHVSYPPQLRASSPLFSWYQQMERFREMTVADPAHKPACFRGLLLTLWFNTGSQKGREKNEEDYFQVNSQECIQLEMLFFDLSQASLKPLSLFQKKQFWKQMGINEKFILSMPNSPKWAVLSDLCWVPLSNEKDAYEVLILWNTNTCLQPTGSCLMREKTCTLLTQLVWSLACRP